MDKILEIIKKECSDDASRLRKFDRRTRLVKDLMKNGIELLDRKQDGCLYLKTPYGCLKFYFQEDRNNKVKIYFTQLCNEHGIPLSRENLTNK